MKQKINLLQVVDGFRLGGAETKLLELIKNLNKDKYNVVVCSLLSDGPLLEKFKETGAKVVIIDRKHRFDFSVIPRIIKLIKKEKIHIVQTTLFYADFLGTITAKLAGVPVSVSWETISHYHSFYKPKYRGLAYRIAMALADKIIAVSDDVKKSILELRKIRPAKIETIPYGVDMRRFRKELQTEKRAELGLKKDDLIIGVVARLDYIKGHIYLIDALPKIKNSYKNVKCVIVGDGESRQKLEERCEKLKLVSDVKFLGFRSDVADILQIFDVFVLPSLSEGLPNVILEAMACSVPVVATAVGGIPEVITDNWNGKLVPPKDSEAIARAISEVFSQNGERKKFTQNAWNLVKEKYSLQRQMKQFDSLYSELLIKKGVDFFLN